MHFAIQEFYSHSCYHGNICPFGLMSEIYICFMSEKWWSITWGFVVQNYYSFQFCSREKAILAVTLCNDREQIMGHASFFDYPNLSGVDSAVWEEWLKKYYDCDNCSALNSLFMHYFVAKAEYPQGCAREIIRTAFNAVPDLHFLFLIVPLGVYPGKG